MPSDYDMTPTAVARDLRAALARLDAVAREVTGRNRAKARAAADYRAAKARARLSSDARTVDLRDAETDLACYQDMLARNLAECDADAAITEAASLRTIVTGFQSLLRLAEVENSLANTPGVRAAS